MSNGINVVDIAFVRFDCPDLDEMQSFLEDFGMSVAAKDDQTLHMRGTSSAPVLHVTNRAETAGFRGLAFRAESLADLETLAKTDEFSSIADLETPGGGSVVRATDPDGVHVEVIAGQTAVDPLNYPRAGVTNRADERPRTGETVRLTAGPAHVMRLGHCVLDVADYPTTSAWYADHLGLIVSDEVMLDDTKALGAFMRCDRGDDFVDHHTMFFVGSGKVRFNHAAYEVANVDDLMLGHTHLTEGDRAHHWGIGRHILGSQVYDYWRDPFGHVLEHWTDGDLFNNTTPPNKATLADLLGSQWGPTHGSP